MDEAGRSIQTLLVTESVRDATIGGRKVKHGQTIALGPDDGLVASDGDREKAVLAAIKALTPRLRAPDPVLRRRSGSRRGGDDGATDRGDAARASRSRSATAGSRSTGTSSQPSRRGQGDDPGTGTDRPGRAAVDPTGAVRLGGRRSAAASRHQARLLHRSRPALPPAAALRRPARDAQDRRSRLGDRWDGGLGPGDGRGRAGRARLPRPDPADDRAARGRDREHRRHLVRATLHRAPAVRRRRDRRVGQGQAFRSPADPRQSRVPGRRRRHGAAPRRTDRAGLRPDGGAHRGPAPVGHPRGARQGGLRVSRVPAGRDRRRGGAGADHGGDRGGPLPGDLPGPRRCAPPPRVRRAPRAPARDGGAPPPAGPRCGARGDGRCRPPTSR